MFDDLQSVNELFGHTSFEIGSLDSEEHSHNKIGVNCCSFYDHYWLKKFRLALKEGEHRTQRKLQRIFSPCIFEWIQDHPKGSLLCCLHTEEFYVEEIFKRFWRTLGMHQIFEFTSMADILSHLQASVNGVILDTLRNNLPSLAASSINNAVKAEVMSDETDHRSELWEYIERTCSNRRERKIAFLLFNCHLKPLEIVASFPNDFSDINEISKVYRNIVLQSSRCHSFEMVAKK
jgi:hypothetical protein